MGPLVSKSRDFGLGPLYSPVRLLGKGVTGEVWLCRHTQTRQLHAVKLLSRPLLAVTKQVAANEIQLLQEPALQGHPGFCLLEEVLVTGSHLALVFRYEAGGSLSDYVSEIASGAKGTELCVSEDMACFLLRQLMSAVAFLHRRHLAHCDIKLDNTILDGDSPPRLRLCDFQFATHWGQRSAGSIKRHAGTVRYMAPELIANWHDGRGYDPAAADVWACGVWLVTLLTGHFPYNTHSGDTTALEPIWRQQLLRLWSDSPAVKPYISQLTQQLIDLVDGMLETDPRHRITAAGVLTHHWTSRVLPRELQEAWEDIQWQEAARQKARRRARPDSS